MYFVEVKPLKNRMKKSEFKSDLSIYKSDFAFINRSNVDSEIKTM